MTGPIARIHPEPHRILLVGNETLASEEVVASLDGSAAGAEVLVVAPALDRRRGRPPDERPRRAAERRLAGCLATLREEGVAAEGIIGDAEPLVAIEDALRVFPADEIVIATHRAPSSGWLARRVVERAAQRFWHPVRHVVVEGSPVRAAA